MPHVPAARRRDRAELDAQGSLARDGPALPGRLRRAAPQAGRVRDGRHRDDGVLLVLPGRGRLHHVGQAERDPGRAGPRLGRPARSWRTRSGITDLDPIVHGLVFERFLNPERISMPDIDIDFDERRRGDVIRYVTEKYGDDRVAQIITYGTIKAKAAVKDSARVLGFPYALGDRITKAFPPAVMGKDIPLSGDLRPRPPALRRGGRDPGAVRGRGRGQPGHRHRPRPGGPDPPARRARGRGDHEQRAAARPHPGLAARGRRGDHHAVRLPGVRRHRPAQDGLPRPAQPHGPRRRASPGSRPTAASRSTWTTSALDDKPTYELLARGDTLGVFQLDGGPMRALLRAMRPDKFGDISAVIALYRPGPMAQRARSMPTARPAGRRSRRSTPSSPSRWPTSWARATACSSTRRT